MVAPRASDRVKQILLNKKTVRNTYVKNKQLTMITVMKKGPVTESNIPPQRLGPAFDPGRDAPRGGGNRPPWLLP